MCQKRWDETVKSCRRTWGCKAILGYCKAIGITPSFRAIHLIRSIHSYNLSIQSLAFSFICP